MAAAGAYQVTVQRPIMITALAALFFGPALAQNLPRRIGDYGHWTAAMQQDRGRKLCYAFTGATRMSHPRSDVRLMVTRGQHGGDEVALTAGYRYPRHPRVSVTVGRTVLPFEAESTAAFARNGQAAIAAFRRGNEAVARGPRRAGRTGTVTDRFSLRGFTAAYNAIRRECPPLARRRR
jgi:hypothetical protein